MEEKIEKRDDGNKLNHLLVLVLYIGIVILLYMAYRSVMDIIEMATYEPQYTIYSWEVASSVYTPDFTLPIIYSSLAVVLAIVGCIGRIFMLKLNKIGFYMIVAVGIIDCIMGYAMLATTDVEFNNRMVPDELYPVVSLLVGLGGFMLLMLTTKNKRNAYQVLWNNEE